MAEKHISKNYWPNGKIQKEEIRKKGNILTIKNYTIEGNLWQEISYDKNLDKHGPHRRYYPSISTLKSVENYKHGFKEGCSCYFSSKGYLLLEDIYEKDILKIRKIQMIGIIYF